MIDRADLKVVPFVPRPTEETSPKDDVVELLTDLLELAGEGLIVSIACAFVGPDGGVAVTWSSSDQVAAQLGAVSSLHAQYARLCEEDVEER